MDINDIKRQAVERIWLFPGEHDGETTLLWCDDPAPGEGMGPAEAVEYVRKDVHEARIAELERERDMHKAAEEAQIALRQKADERITKLEGMRTRSRKERAQLCEGIAALQAHINYMEEIYKQWNRHEIDDKQFLSLLSILINRLPSASLAIRDAEQQRIGAASFRHELREASSVVIRPHIQGVFEVWLRQQAEANQ